VISLPRFGAIAMCIVAVASGGCFKLARTSPPVEHYVLGGLHPADATTPTDSGGLAIGLRRVDVAPYLSTLAIVVRRADNEILTTGFHRWAESPVAGLNRSLAEYIAASPGVRSVDVAPWHVRTKQDLVVQLHVLRLEGLLTGERRGEGHVLARWEIIRPDDGAILARGATEHRAPGWTAHDYPGLVARLDAGLVVVAREVTDCLARVRLLPRTDSLVPGVPAMDCAAR
jgi:uncharacterized lipoprotein YmbA